MLRVLTSAIMYTVPTHLYVYIIHTLAGIHLASSANICNLISYYEENF